MTVDSETASDQNEATSAPLRKDADAIVSLDADESSKVQDHNAGAKPKKRGNKWDDVSRHEWHKSKRNRANNDRDDNDEARSDVPRKPKRKVAVLVGYCGTGYHGMQLNPPNKTIEGTLFEAFVATGAVSRDNADDPKKGSAQYFMSIVGLMRSRCRS